LLKTLEKEREHLSAMSAGKINAYLVSHGLLIKNNPAISPDLTLDFPSLVKEIRLEADALLMCLKSLSQGKSVPELQGMIFWPKSSFPLGNALLYVIESKRSGDSALITISSDIPHFDGVERIHDAFSVIPLGWENLIRLKNAVLEHDPLSTIFPKADSRLQRTSLGIGARFTTLHWPAVAWAMKALRLPFTANQNSIPRELVYDIEAMLENRLHNVPFPFIGGSVPEGHQGQSVKGMSHASIITLLKYGFHKNKIPWGFNADHQPIGGRFDEIETELVEGSLFASYITYDLSPELAQTPFIEDQAALETVFARTVDPELFKAVVHRLKELNLGIPEPYVKQMVTYLMPAMKKMKRRDQCYVALRRHSFTTEEGCRFLRELSIDELTGETTLDAFSVCLALTEALGIHFDFIAPNFRFQKNIPYADNEKLRGKIREFYQRARFFDVSIGFHSGSGKSTDNYRVIGEETEGRFEIKTSGRYTYEMGVALSQSNDPRDRKLWEDWYAFAKELVIKSAFSTQETQRQLAREFITGSLAAKRIATESVFESSRALARALDSLSPSPDHIFWFEYNFLFVLAAGGESDRLGDHSVDGYRQRGRFYGISEEAKLCYAQRVALYIMFLAETTGIAQTAIVAAARDRLLTFTSYNDLLDEIG
jgi:hypothetical protein